MIVAVCLHTMRVYFTGAYRQPRELTWVVGCLLLFTTLAAGLSGYSLVYEQLSYWGATVTSNLVAAVPGIGHFLARLVRGGDTVGAATLTRFFVAHIAILPGLIGLLVVAHVILIRVHGVSELKFKNSDSEPRVYPFIPDHLLIEVSIALVLMTLLNVVAVLHPAGLGERADPRTTPEHGPGQRPAPVVPADSKECVECHAKVSPVIVEQWSDSKHALRGIGCVGCHRADEKDVDAFIHKGVRIATIVSPKDCARCHPKEVKEQAASRHAEAANTAGSPDELLGAEVEGNPTPTLGCNGCHGSVVKVLGPGKLDPNTWPNGGMGRVNPDGSKGSCAACHYRHD